MLGMMPQKGGGSTNVPGNPMNSGGMSPQIGQAPPTQQGGGMPSKGGGMTNMPVSGMGGGLASLFMGNRPTGPQTGGPMPVNPILQPKAPVIPMPTTHPVVPPPAAASQMPSVYQGPIQNRADLMNYQVRYSQPGANTQGLPTPEEMRLRYITGLGNYSNSGGGGRR